jgi:uncharacterized protein (TIGR02099 family)
LRILKNLLIGLILLWGLLALVVRAATPFIADYRDELATALSGRLGAPVTVGALEARWYGLRPLLELHEVSVGNAPHRLKIRLVTLDLAATALLTGSLPDALRVTVDGLQLTAVREATGQVHLEGIGQIGQDREGTAAPPLPRRLRLLNTRVVWIDRRAGKAPLTLDDVAVVLERDGSRLRLRASLHSPSGRADLSARLDGFLGTTAWEGETYLRVRDLDVARLFAHYLPEHYGLRRMHLDLESWGQWRDATPVHEQGRFALHDLDLRPTHDGAGALRLSRAAAGFSLARNAAGLRIGLTDLQLDFGGHRWPAGDLALALSETADGGRRLAAAADYLRIEDAIRILEVRQPWPALAEPLARLAPQGELRDLRLQAELGDADPKWRARAAFTGLSTATWNRLPGVEGLSGQLHGQQDHLVLQLDSRGAALHFDELFRDPLEFERLYGRLDLLPRTDGWQLASDLLEADTPHLRTRTRLRLEQQPGRRPFIDLQSAFSDGDAAFAARYCPVGVMDEELVRWLDRSIKSGRVSSGSALLYGPLDDFAFEKTRSGVFQVIFDAQDVVLDYQRGWPALEGLAARVKFHGNQLEIAADAGAVYDSRLVQASARIDSLDPIGPIRIRGRVDGPLQDKLRLLGEDALRERFGEFAEVLRGRGQSRLLLDFTVPLSRKHGAYALDGRLRFNDAGLSLPDWGIDIMHIDGELAFDLAGVRAQGIRAHALGTPLSVDVGALADGATRVRSHGRLAVEAIRRQLPALPDGLAYGAAAFTVDVELPPRGAPGDSSTSLVINSDLAGIGVQLPPPFGKPADEVRALAVRVPLGPAVEGGSLRYGERVDAAFSGDGQRIDLVLGGGRASLGTAPGIRIGGRLGQVDVAAWAAAFGRLAPGDGAAHPPTTLDLAIDRLELERLGIADLELKAIHDTGLWRGGVASETLAGSFVVADALDEIPIQVALERLHLEAPVGAMDTTPAPAPDPASGPDPQEMPGMMLSIADLRINQARLGQLQFDAQRAPEGLRVTRLNLAGGALELESAGHWTHGRAGVETHLGGRASTANLGDLLVDLGYSRQLDQAGGSIEFLLHWSGHPGQAHRATLTGEAGLEIDSGRLVELDPGVSRVFGLLNLNALTRRLRLDFSDVYRKGYSFDSIKGDFRFADGVARTDNLSVLGPSGRIEIEGKADLMARALDQHVQVTPNFDATLPIAGTLAGGPIAGLAVLVAQRALDDDIDNINRFEYRVTGPWDDPEVKQLDSGGTLSKILRPLGGGQTADAPPDPTPPDGSLPEAAPRAPSAVAGGPAERAKEAPPAQPTAEADRARNPLSGLLEILKKGESHGADLPGTSN